MNSAKYFLSSIIPLLLMTAQVINSGPAVSGRSGSSPSDLRRMAEDYYKWRNENYPVNSSNEGLHTWDDRLTDYSATAVKTRREHVKNLLGQVNAMETASWPKDDRIDHILFRAQLEGVAFF